MNEIHVSVRCSECGEIQEEPRDPDYPQAIGDYAEYFCPLCGEETEHEVVEVAHAD